MGWGGGHTHTGYHVLLRRENEQESVVHKQKERPGNTLFEGFEAAIIHFKERKERGCRRKQRKRYDDCLIKERRSVDMQYIKGANGNSS